MFWWNIGLCFPVIPPFSLCFSIVIFGAVDSVWCIDSEIWPINVLSMIKMPWIWFGMTTNYPRRMNGNCFGISNQISQAITAGDGRAAINRVPTIRLSSLPFSLTSLIQSMRRLHCESPLCKRPDDIGVTGNPSTHNFPLMISPKKCTRFFVQMVMK